MTALSRRAVLGTIAMTAGAAGVALPSSAMASDAAIIRAWETRKRAYAANNALPDDSGPVTNGHSDAEHRLWGMIDEAEETIRSTVARTPRGAAIQLWCAISHSVVTQADEAAILSEDLSALQSRGDDMDWNLRLVLAALASLLQMEG